MKKILLFFVAFILGSIGTLYIRQSFADSDSTPTKTPQFTISHFKLPQPEEVVLQTMQQVNAPIVVPHPPVPTDKTSSFAALLKPLAIPKVLGAMDTISPRAS